MHLQPAVNHFNFSTCISSFVKWKQHNLSASSLWQHNFRFRQSLCILPP